MEDVFLLASSMLYVVATYPIRKDVVGRHLLLEMEHTTIVSGERF